MRYRALVIAAGWVIASAVVLLEAAPVGAQETAETAASLIAGLVRREALIRDLRGYLLDRAWLTPWYAATRGPQVLVTVAGPTTAGGPPPPEKEDNLYGAYFGSFVVAPAYCRTDMAALKLGDENLWSIAGATGAQVSFSAGFGAAGGEPPPKPTPAVPKRFLILREKGRVKTQRSEGMMVLGFEVTEPVAELAIQQEPLATMLFGRSTPTLAQALQAAEEAARAAGGAGQAPPEEVVVSEPTERAGREQYRLTWRDPDRGQWAVWVCPAWGYAPTQLTRIAAPAAEDRLPLNTERVVRRWEFSEFTQLADDLWLPQKVLFFEFIHSADTPEQHPPLARVHELTLYDLAVNTDPEKKPLPPPIRGEYPGVLAALVGYYPELADRQAWLQAIIEKAAEAERPQAPEEAAMDSDSVS